MKDIRVMLHDVRSIYNVGSVFRTADGLGYKHLVLTGITPYPTYDGDTRPPHVRRSTTNSIEKTALGAEKSVEFEYIESGSQAIKKYKSLGYTICAIEQTNDSVSVEELQYKEKLLLILGNEVKGLPESILNYCDAFAEIPMNGAKESFNVSVTAALVMYELNRTKL